MTYVMSDIHGRYDKYLNMLELIGFGEGDTLYLLGDYADRGPDGVKVWLDVMDRPNVICLKGNHDDFAARGLADFVLSETPPDYADREDYICWIGYNGGNTTLAAFRQLDAETQERIVSFLENLPFYKETVVGGRPYLLAHTVPECGLPDEITEEDEYDFIWDRPDFDTPYNADKTVVIGHTPTGHISRDYIGRIWSGNGIINVDCGAAYGYPLGCLRLDDMEEFYIA